MCLSGGHSDDSCSSGHKKGSRFPEQEGSPVGYHNFNFIFYLNLTQKPTNNFVCVLNDTTGFDNKVK